MWGEEEEKQKGKWREGKKGGREKGKEGREGGREGTREKEKEGGRGEGMGAKQLCCGSLSSVLGRLSQRMSLLAFPKMRDFSDNQGLSPATPTVFKYRVPLKAHIKENRNNNYLFDLFLPVVPSLQKILSQGEKTKKEPSQFKGNQARLPSPFFASSGEVGGGGEVRFSPPALPVTWQDGDWMYHEHYWLSRTNEASPRAGRL